MNLVEIQCRPCSRAFTQCIMFQIWLIVIRVAQSGGSRKASLLLANTQLLPTAVRRGGRMERESKDLLRTGIALSQWFLSVPLTHTASVLFSTRHSPLARRGKQPAASIHVAVRQRMRDSLRAEASFSERLAQSSSTTR